MLKILEIKAKGIHHIRLFSFNLDNDTLMLNNMQYKIGLNWRRIPIPIKHAFMIELPQLKTL